MTCIVGIAEKGKVFIGGDSAGVSDTDMYIRADSKVFNVGPYIFGFTSSFRMGQLLRYSLKLPAPPKNNEDLSRFMCTKFVKAVQGCFSDGSFGNSQEGGIFLVGVKGQLFTIEQDYQVCQVYETFQSVGCGRRYAMGSLATSIGDAKDRILKALQVTEQFSNSVRGPFTILSSK